MSEYVLLVSEAAEPGDDGPHFVLLTRAGGEAVDVGERNVTRYLQMLTENSLDTSLKDVPKNRYYYKPKITIAVQKTKFSSSQYFLGNFVNCNS